ncbi:MAG: hypothetical protein Q8Q06_01090 [bacterium]|nr:hypothetical protein [bacterium]
MDKSYLKLLTPGELQIFKKLNTPVKVQDYLEKLPINFEPKGETLMSPRRVMREGVCHCIEAAIFGAAIFWFHGQRPLLLDLKTEDTDESHVVAPFKKDGLWGAISKTNHTVLRYRDPIYRDPRELAMSYFNEYFLGKNGKKTLRSYSAPFDLSKLAHKNWLTSEEDMWYMDEALENARHYPLIKKSAIRDLRPADPIERKELRQFEVYKDNKSKF